MADKPVTREEKYLAYLTGDYTGELPKPITRKEKYLYELCLKGIGGEISPEEIKNAVNEYLEKNPVKPGATTEQAQQIEQNKTDVASLKKETGSLKEDLSNKITKFYASNQGETHLADSDNGKIMDMMVYGRSEQKQYSGKNLFDANDTGGPFPLSADSNGWYIVEMSNAGSNIVYKNITTKPSNKLKPSTLYTIIVETEYLEEALVCVSSTYPSNVTEFKGQINTDIEIKKTGISKATATTVDDFSNSDTLLRTFVRIDPGKTAKAKFRISIVEDDATEKPNWEYEPYTGGIPSPNPDYPQEIKSVVNPTVKVCGKNLYPDGDLIELTKSYTTDFIPVVFNRNTIYLAFECNTNTVDGKYYINMIYYDKNKQKLGSNGSASQIGEKITKIEDSSSFNGIGAGNGGTNVDLKKVSYVKIVFNIYDNTATKITYKNIVVSSTPTAYEPYHEQTVTLPYTLNAIPVESGGNVTINGQQYIADYVDVERGKLVRCVKKLFLKQYQWSKAINKGVLRFYASTIDAVGIDSNKVMKNAFSISSHFAFVTSAPDRIGTFITNADGTNANIGFAFSTDTTTSSDDFNNWILNNKPFVFLPVLKEELPLTSEQTQALKELATYYPVTNISVNSEQLDGYTVFNYPISMENGWNYVKQQIGDTRDYIYDMDARAQDTDLQAAEAYVNSEYAVALTELEV